MGFQFSNEDDINRTPVNHEHENPVVIKATESGSCQEEPTQSLDSFSSIQNKVIFCNLYILKLLISEESYLLIFIT